jgi:hypothetical protein
MAIGASLFATGGAVYYTATHPGASFDRWDYLAAVMGAGVQGAVLGAAVYLAPAAVGSGMSAAGMDAIGTAVWLNRIGISAYGVMRVGQWSYNWGITLQSGGWQVLSYAFSRRNEAFKGLGAHSPKTAKRFRGWSIERDTHEQLSEDMLALRMLLSKILTMLLLEAVLLKLILKPI